jgi:hypothetical protein
MNTMDATHSLLVDIGTERNKCLNVLPAFSSGPDFISVSTIVLA